MTAQHPRPGSSARVGAGVEDILFLAEQATARHGRRGEGGSAGDDDPSSSDKTREAMFILLSRLNQSFDHQRDRERAELLASVRRS
jgi:hypothetical protein